MWRSMDFRPYPGQPHNNDITSLARLDGFVFPSREAFFLGACVVALEHLIQVGSGALDPEWQPGEYGQHTVPRSFSS
jgi:hypothetical protein